MSCHIVICYFFRSKNGDYLNTIFTVQYSFGFGEGQFLIAMKKHPTCWLFNIHNHSLELLIFMEIKLKVQKIVVCLWLGTFEGPIYK